MEELTKTQDLYHAFLCHQNIFREIENYQVPAEVTGVFNQTMEWLQEFIRMNDTHLELKSEINLVYNGQKIQVVEITKLAICYIIMWQFSWNQKIYVISNTYPCITDGTYKGIETVRRLQSKCASMHKLIGFDFNEWKISNIRQRSRSRNKTNVTFVGRPRRKTSMFGNRRPTLKTDKKRNFTKQQAHTKWTSFLENQRKHMSSGEVMSYRRERKPGPIWRYCWTMAKFSKCQQRHNVTWYDKLIRKRHVSKSVALKWLRMTRQNWNKEHA